MILDREALTQAERDRLDAIVRTGPYTEADVARFLLAYDMVEVDYVLSLLEDDLGL